MTISTVGDGWLERQLADLFIAYFHERSGVPERERPISTDDIEWVATEAMRAVYGAAPLPDFPADGVCTVCGNDSEYRYMELGMCRHEAVECQRGEAPECEACGGEGDVEVKDLGNGRRIMQDCEACDGDGTIGVPPLDGPPHAYSSGYSGYSDEGDFAYVWCTECHAAYGVPDDMDWD